MKKVGKANLSKNEDIRFILQRTETTLDSLSQKLVRQLGPRHEFSRKAKYALHEVRKAQFRYYPVTTHSLLRYSDSKFDDKGKIIRNLAKQNWPKFKKIQERKKLTPLTSTL